MKGRMLLTEKKPLKLKDFHRQRLLQGDVGGSEDEGDYSSAIKTHEDEQNELLNEFRAAAMLEENEGDDGGLLKIRPKTEAELEKDEEDYKKKTLTLISSLKNQFEKL